jgi:hypothetical protein
MANVLLRNTATVDTVEIYSSGARTATPDSYELSNQRCRGLYLVISVTALTSTPSLVVKLQGVDTENEVAWDILTSPTITEIGTTVMQIGPGIERQGNTAVNGIVPPRFRISATHGDSDSITYSVVLMKNF